MNSTLRYWVWFSSLTELTARSRQRLLERFGSARDIFHAGEAEWREAGVTAKRELDALKDRDLARAGDILSRCADMGAAVITAQDAGFPRRLAAIPDPPSVLYVRGHLPDVDAEAAVAIAGTRRASPYGIKMGLHMGYSLSKSGAMIVSGLAAGVDSAGARGALRAGGRVIGVLGTPIDQVYPRANAGLYEDVLTVGAIVSEYPPGAKLSPRLSFPARNRLISGLSAGVVIIEAPKGSGALITADRALEQGRELFAVPGNADAPNCQGSNALIRDCAKAVTEAWDVLAELEPLFPDKLRHLTGREAAVPDMDTAEAPPPAEKTETLPPETGQDFVRLRQKNLRRPEEGSPAPTETGVEEALKDLSPGQLRIVSVMTRPSMHVDDIIDLSGLGASAVLADLTMLQIRGIVRQESGKRFSLNIIRRV